MIDTITLRGGLPRDAETRYTPNGHQVTEFTLAQSDATTDEQGNWQKKQALYLDCVVWNENGQNKQNPTPWAEIAATLQKGDQVAVSGKLITDSWETTDGSKRSKIKFLVRELYKQPAAPSSTPQPSTGGFGDQTQQQAWDSIPTQPGTRHPAGRAGEADVPF